MTKKTQKSRPKTGQQPADKVSSAKAEQKETSVKVSSSEELKTPPVKKPIPKTTKEPETMDELLSLTGGLVIGVKKGDTVEGAVISTSPKEILVDIGKKSYGIVAEWELEQVREFAAKLKIGDKVIAQVMNTENEVGYIVLSLRRSSQEHRWSYLTTAKEKGEDIEVVGLEVAKGGLLVDWQGLRGFIPATQLEGSLASNPASLISRRVKVKVLEVDKALNRMVLSQRASSLGVTPVHQKEKLDKIKVDDVLKGTISGIAPFGIFVDVDGLEGLVHISEIAWERVDNPANMYKVGVMVEVKVLDVNKDEGKLNLSVKRLTPDPWKNILDRYPMDSSVSGKVVRSAPYGLFVSLEPGIEGLLHVSKLTTGEEPKVGDSIECMIEHIDAVRRKISLTLVPTVKPVGYR